MTRGSCLQSSLYVGSVFHRRLKPKPHRFRYRLFWLLIDLEELDDLDRRLKVFSHNRFNLFSLFDRDHGDGGASSLGAQARELLAAHGIDAGGPIRLLCMPRTLGYGFNPLSVYFCSRTDGALAALIYQVHNTFGERHSYVLPVDGRGGAACGRPARRRSSSAPSCRWDCGTNSMRRRRAETLTLAIRASGPDGPVLRAALAGERRELTDAALLKAALSAPLEAMKTTAAIHWEALRLWAKGVAYLGREGARARG